MSIGNKIMKLQVGDKIRINDWEQPFSVCGVSENYVLAYCGQEYTIIAKRPADYQYNGIMPGAYVFADVAPVRHGQWVHTDLAARWNWKDECSKCTYHEKDRSDLSRLNYCPNCGARMDGDDHGK